MIMEELRGILLDLSDCLNDISLEMDSSEAHADTYWIRSKLRKIEKSIWDLEVGK
jgi:hypothetical protein